jgi:5-methylcytosine-specific restriction endonuclease McrA
MTYIPARPCERIGCYEVLEACHKRRPQNAPRACRRCRLEAKRERDRRYCQTNREARVEYQRRYRQENLEAERESDRLYRKENPALGKAAGHRRRARKLKAAVAPVTSSDIRDILDRHDYRCAVCLAPAEHLDHVLPLSRGGAHAVPNLRPLCAPCNLSKGAKTDADWLHTRIADLDHLHHLTPTRSAQ